MTWLLPLARLSPRITPSEFPAWEKAFPLGQKMSWNPNTQVFSLKERVPGLHFILSGRFRCYTMTAEGKQRTIWIMHEHSLVGDVALFNDNPPIYIMESETQAATVFFSRRVFLEKILPGFPEVNLSIMRILALKVRWQSADAQDQNFLPSWKRVGEFLFSCARSHGNSIAVNHADIAEFLGMHRVTVSKAVARLKEMNLLHADKKGLHITDMDRFVNEVLNQQDAARPCREYTKNTER